MINNVSFRGLELAAFLIIGSLCLEKLPSVKYNVPITYLGL
jgi:hypothetical protein